jgi:AraC-like DNA-binding protein
MLHYTLASQYGPFALHPADLPATSSMPGTALQSCEDANCRILLHEIQTDRFCILYSIIQVKQPITLSFTVTSHILHLHVNMKEDCQLYIKTLGGSVFHEREFNLTYAEKVEGSAQLEAGKEYRLLQVFFPMELLQQLQPCFPKLAAIMQYTSTRPQLLFPEHNYLSDKWQGIIHDILYPNFDEAVQLFYIESKLRELLFLILYAGYSAAAAKNTLSKKDRDIGLTAKALIEQDIQKHFTIARLSKQLNITVKRLKTIFKQETGMGAFEYLTHLRMQHARSLLIDSDKPIKEIVKLTGYANVAGFQKAFKKYFATNPATFRSSQIS